MKRIILVDESDKPQGFAGREECHRMPGKLHRAILVVLLDQKKGILLTRRVKDKLWGGIWDGTVATHVYRGETVEQAASRGLLNELGLETLPLEYDGKFLYRANWGKDWVEYEVCYVFKSQVTLQLSPNKNEVTDLEWVAKGDLERRAKENQTMFTPWLLIAVKKLKLF